GDADTAANGSAAVAWAIRRTKTSSGADNAVNGHANAGASWAAAAPSTPSHMIGAIAGAARRFAGSEASETRPKYSAISGAVPSVAAMVIAAASATGRGRRRPSAVRSGG